MKRNFLLLLCIVALIAVSLASCDNHEHTFSDEWTGDAANHWHPASCEHGEVKEGLGAHADVDEDGVCDVCAMEIGHQHTFVDEWSTDDDNHWKNATCSHTDVKGELSLHIDDDSNGSCDVCAAHVHKVNAAGYCTHEDCGKKIKEIDETSLDELVNAVVAQQGLVNGGHLVYNVEGRSNTGPNYVASKNDVVDYLFGKDAYTYAKVLSSAVNAGVSAESKLETWHQLTGPETTFGIYSEDGGETFAMDMPNVDRLNGYYIALSTLAGDYGVENTLYSLYQAAIDDSVKELEVIPDTAENKVTFKYNYKTVLLNATDIAVGDLQGQRVYNVNYFEVEVTFTYSDEYALTSLDFVIDCYTNDPGTSDVDGFLYKDVDIEYDPETDTFEFVEYVQTTDASGNTVWVSQPTDKRTPDTYTLTVTQTLGERTEENPHPKSHFVPESFDLYATKEEHYNSDGLTTSYELKDLITDKLKVDVGSIVNLYVGNYSPVGTSLHYIADQVTLKLYKDGVLVENSDDYLNTTAVAMFTFSGSLRSFFVVPKVDGFYKLEIYVLGELEKEVSIEVGVVDEGNLDLKDNEFVVKVTETYAWTNEYTFTATEAGTYYFYLPAGIGFIDADALDAADQTPATDDSPDPYFDYQDLGNENGGNFSITLEAGQSIRFYTSAAKRGTYVISYFII
ncbi:MAG: hypothetical protein IJX97_01925 [Clostridia bacterium]|nr:hypothetical protein [Clostridia bacterium]